MPFPLPCEPHVVTNLPEGVNITRVSDGATSRNGVGSVRRLKLGPLPAFEETTTTAEPNTLIEYKITKGSPLKGHWGRQELTPTAGGGTRLDYTIGFDSAIPGLAALVGMVLAPGRMHPVLAVIALASERHAKQLWTDKPSRIRTR